MCMRGPRLATRDRRGRGTLICRAAAGAMAHRAGECVCACVCACVRACVCGQPSRSSSVSNGHVSPKHKNGRFPVRPARMSHAALVMCPTTAPHGPHPTTPTQLRSPLTMHDATRTCSASTISRAVQWHEASRCMRTPTIRAAGRTMVQALVAVQHTLWLRSAQTGRWLYSLVAFLDSDAFWHDTSSSLQSLSSDYSGSSQQPCASFASNQPHVLPHGEACVRQHSA